ncbi:hypothetical protein [Haloterrigena salina]|uniref:hypothetical protein n=1 Tax=Haloterrigena salina TaxID=504937 RepID=UPI0012691C81|nr:hypothetical protein [Haloterrigena salina]
MPWGFISNILNAVPWGFISGILVAFFGAFIAHLFVSYRNQQDRYQELINLLAQIAELDKEQFREAGNAAVEAQKKEVDPTEIVHQGNRLWRLRERVHEVAEPIYTELPSECKDSIDRMDEWIMKLRDGPGASHITHQWVTGEAGNAIQSIPSFRFITFLQHYFNSEKPQYPATMELKEKEQSRVQNALKRREQKMEEKEYGNEENEDVN